MRDGAALFVADEDRSMLRRFALPLGLGEQQHKTLPGKPAAVLSLGNRVLVTVRQPGLLIALRSSDLSEISRVALPSDAWGIGLSQDGATALVTSAWSRKVSAVDVADDDHALDLAGRP